MTYDDLATMLEPVGLTVVSPGGAVAALPCITLEPTGMSLLPGVLNAFDTCNINVRYSLGTGDMAQFESARTATGASLMALKGTQVVLEADVPVIGDSTTATPSFFFQIAAAFPGIGLCPDDPPAP